MITIKNRQKKISINEREIKKDVESMLACVNCVNCVNCSEKDIGIWFTTNHTIRKYNKKYRKKDKITDILSFPMGDERDLGDIIISLERAQSDAGRENRSFKEHMRILLAHGIAHLLGFDHQTDEDYKNMQKKERQLLAAL